MDHRYIAPFQRPMIRALCFVLAVGFFCLLTGAAYAETSGVLRGRVTNGGTGVGLLRALVAVNGTTTCTAADGSYAVTLPAGQVTVSASDDLFRSSPVQSLSLGAGETVTLDIALQPSGEWPMFGGSERHQRAVPVRGNMTTAPGVLWKYPLKPAKPSLEAVFDVDGDGACETVLIAGERMYVYRGDGSLLWESRSAEGNEIGSLIGIMDLDADGTMDIVTGNLPSSDSYGRYRLARLAILNGRDGSLEYVSSFFDNSNGHCGATGHGSANNLNRYNVRIGDLDGDGKPEILMMPGYGHAMRVLDFDNGLQNAAAKYTVSYPNNYAEGVAVGDIDGDGKAEIVTNWLGVLYAYNAETGSLKAQSSIFASGDTQGACVIADVDHDGVNEIVQLASATHTVSVFDATTTAIALKWKKQYAGYLRYSHDAVADLDQDGQLEILFSIDSDRMYVLCASDGSEKWSVLGRYPKGTCDVNGDGVPEILGGTSTLSGKNACVYKGTPAGYSEKATMTGQSWISGPGSVNCSPGQNYYGGTSTPDVAYLTTGTLVATGGVLSQYDLTGPSPVLNWSYIYSANKARYDLSAAQGDVDGDGTTETVLVVDDGTLRVLGANGHAKVNVPISFGSLCEPRVADLNHDGINEIVVQKWPATYNEPTSYQGDMEVLVATTATLSVPPARTALGYSGLYSDLGALQMWSPAIADLNGDGKLETLVTQDGSQLAAVKSDGTTLWSASCRADYLGVGHFRGAASYDVFAADTAHNFTVLNGQTGGILWSGTKTSKWIPAVADLNSDGIDDIAALGMGNHVFAYSGLGGTLLWDDSSNCAMCYDGTVAVGDTNGDGQEELVSSGNFGIVDYSSAGHLNWQQQSINSEGLKDHFCSLVSLNGHGALDVVQPSSHGVYAFDGRTGTELWRFFSDPCVAVSPTIAADIDSDGLPEIIFSCNDGYLYALRSDGTLDWRVYFGYQLGVPVVADVNNDHMAEILVSSNGFLYCLAATQPLVTGIRTGVQNTIAPEGTIAYKPYPGANDIATDLAIVPSRGTTHVDIVKWQTSGAGLREWSEYNAGAGVSTDHAVGGLVAAKRYEVMANGTRIALLRVDASGQISFRHAATTNRTEFLVTETQETAVALSRFEAE